MAGNLLDTLGDLDGAEFVTSASTEGLVPGVAGELPTPEPVCCLSPCGMGTCTKEHYCYSSGLQTVVEWLLQVSFKEGSHSPRRLRCGWTNHKLPWTGMRSLEATLI